MRRLERGEHGFQDLGNAGQQVVADAMTQGVVHLLEAVQVDVQQAAGARRGGSAAGERRFDFDAELLAVGQAGQRVGVHQAVLVGFERERVAQAQAQLARVYRLGQQIGGPQLQRFQLGGRIALRGQYDHRRIAQLLVPAHFRQDVEARHLRHHQVQEQNVRAMLHEQSHRLLGLAGGDEAHVARLFQVGLYHLQHQRIVVHHHHGGGPQRCEGRPGAGRGGRGAELGGHSGRDALCAVHVWCSRLMRRRRLPEPPCGPRSDAARPPLQGCAARLAPWRTARACALAW